MPDPSSTAGDTPTDYLSASLLEADQSLAHSLSSTPVRPTQRPKSFSIVYSSTGGATHSHCTHFFLLSIFKSQVVQKFGQPDNGVLAPRSW
ncbi:Uncharacterized protein TCM_032023 [Theobroma cacao]|uniref:Uncharacterized protein n=1 Tax=Theobroma cacao TaxID=3641 RepID=A0A061F7W3_THECC|nr:Uncharacterized protein TCM_032023 [Theobroma cacao]